MGRLILAAALATCALWVSAPAHAGPDNCPPACDQIPNSAWIEPAAIPLNSTYRWPGPAGIAVTSAAPRFRFEELCATPALHRDPRDYAIAAKAVVNNPDGQWGLQLQILHWRGETWQGGQDASTTFQAAVAALRACQQTAPQLSPSITTDEPDRLAAVISGSAPGQPVVHHYLLAYPRNSTVSELTMWAGSPPLVQWPATPDVAVLDAMTAPLCVAYIGSCR